ncbi:MAG: amidinotransferase [Reyranella sp.]|uniref:arginine deiminase family protein n=1 Tax=Reyranella sp. TaxID=1929291 RepID=UPI00120DB3AB|nr:arginine deiminase family protein [Reyranella sp.]TAJ40939.1 MAG: amidinotransferase [Reyranella sp.]
MLFGAHHEWGKLREVVIGISPAEDFVVFYEESQRWLVPPGDAFSRQHAGRRLIDVDPERAHRIERQVEALAELVAREGVTVHRPQRLEGEERTFLAGNGEGAQLFPRDGMIVIGNHVIDASIRLKCRQRERYGLRPIIQQVVQQRGARWSSVPLGSPGCVDGPFLEGGDTLLNGYEVYVGISGCASDLAGADWLQALLGDAYRVIPVAMRSNVLHLDCVLALIKPGLLVWCPEKLIDGLPRSLRDWDAIAVSRDEANLLATNALVLEEGRAIVDAGNARVIEELRKRRIDVIPLPFDGPISTGGGLRCAVLR